MKPSYVKFFLYARKSSEGDDKQALSIQSQLEVLRNFAHQQSLCIIDELTERQSAKTPGRPIFDDMMRRIEAGEASGILAWHPDRLARNSKDGGEIIYFVDIGKIVDLKFPTFWFENTPQGKSNLGHEFVQTKQYSDKLACDTKRGLESKAKMGIYPSIAPFGYLNDKATKTIVVDRQVAPIVKEAFETFTRGDRTLESMQMFFAEHGILSKKRNKRAKGGLTKHVDWVRRFLRNPFYYGHFEYSGELYEGKHEAIISKKLFDDVQAVLERRTHHCKPERQPKAFAGLLRCGECGRAITAEIQKGHTYYRCTKKNKAVKCSQKFVREEELDQQISAMIRPFAVPGDWAQKMLAMVDEEEKTASQSARAIVLAKQEEIAKIKGSIDRLIAIYVAQEIDRESFLPKKEELLSRKKVLQEQIKENECCKNSWLEPFREWVNTAKTLGEIAEKGSPQEKKAIALKVFGSNLFLDSKKARGSCVKPWSFIAPPDFLVEMVPRWGLEPQTN